MKTDFIIFVSTLLGCYLISKWSLVSNLLDKFGHFLNKKPLASFSAHEHVKFSLLRIAFGVVLVLRSSYVLYFLIESEISSPVGFWVIAELIAGIFLILGFITQWTLLFLIFGMWQIGDDIVKKATLGNDVAAMLALLLLLTSAGKFISLDSFILKRRKYSRAFLLYYAGHPSPEQIALAKFSALTAFWAVCCYSLSTHLNESAWMSGVAGPMLFTNNFMSSYFIQFTQLFTASPIAVFTARISMWLMMFWYALILPFVLLGGLLRTYVILWGTLFFTLSLVVLNLGYLAEIEFLLWLGIFWTKTGISKDNFVEIFYDDRCNLCTRVVKYLILIDIFHLIKLKPISLNKAVLLQYGISEETALKDIYGRTNHMNTLKMGYDFYILLSKTLIILWPIVPLLYLGKILRIGPVVYKYIANRRLQLFGTCKLSDNNLNREIQYGSNESKMVNAVTLHVCALTICYLIAIPAPFLSYNGIQNRAANAAHFYGITPINVFNSTDLKMADNWFTLTSSNFHEMVPLLNVDGSRSFMHKSDRIYFGYTLQFRRSAIDENGCLYNKYANIIEYVSKSYLNFRKAAPGIYSFTYSQYYRPTLDFALLKKNKFVPYTTENKCVLTYLVHYPEENILESEIHL